MLLRSKMKHQTWTWLLLKYFLVLKSWRQTESLCKPKLHVLLYCVLSRITSYSCRQGVIILVRPSRQRMKKVWSALVYFLSWWPEPFSPWQEFTKRGSCYYSHRHVFFWGRAEFVRCYLQESAMGSNLPPSVEGILGILPVLWFLAVEFAAEFPTDSWTSILSFCFSMLCC